MRKIHSAYLILDPRKFDTENGKREVNRMRSFCVRSKGENEDIHFIIGMSVTSSRYVGHMGYDKPKSQGGKKQFITTGQLKKRYGSTDVGTAITAVPPHIHVMINGYGASSYAKSLIDNLSKRYPTEKFSKIHLASSGDVQKVQKYIENQSTILRKI